MALPDHRHCIMMMVSYRKYDIFKTMGNIGIMMYILLVECALIECGAHLCSLDSRTICLNNKTGSMITSQIDCEKQNCCWDESHNRLNNCASSSSCFIPSSVWRGYRISSQQNDSINSGTMLNLSLTLHVPLPSSVVLGRDIKTLSCEIIRISSNISRIIIKERASSSSSSLLETVSPLPKLQDNDPMNNLKALHSSVDSDGNDNDSMWIALVRTVGMNVSTLFNASRFAFKRGGYVQVSLDLPRHWNVYGLAQHDAPWLLDRGRTYTLFTRDTQKRFVNSYGYHPWIMVMDTLTMKTHGWYLRTSVGLDVDIGFNTITFHLNSGSIFDMFIMSGTTPDRVLKQFQQMIGRPPMPPYWALGWHQCRWGFHNISHIQHVIDMYDKLHIPLDALWTDIDVMQDAQDFTFDSHRFPVDEMQDFIRNTIHPSNRRYVAIVDAGIPANSTSAAFRSGNESNVFIRNRKNNNDSADNWFIGRVWPGSVVWPDFLHPNTTIWWLNQLNTWREKVEIDGIWTDMNEPSSFSIGGNCEMDHKLYPINNNGCRDVLDTATISMNAMHFNATPHLYVHNVYALSQSKTTKSVWETIIRERSLIVTRSTSIGSSKHVAVWLGDNRSTFESMRTSISMGISMSMSGFALVGADICGFSHNASLELCARWHAFGALAYPLARNHNHILSSDQYPFTWPQLAELTRNVLLHRYALVPYVNSLFYRAHRDGGTILRPLLYEFPTDLIVHKIESQFMIGNALLISPCLYENTNVVNVYLPRHTIWFDYWTGEQIGGGQWTIADAPLFSAAPIHIRGGCIIVKHHHHQFTNPMVKSLYELNVKMNFELIVSLDENGYANGELFIDDGRRANALEQEGSGLLKFSAMNQTIYGRVQWWEYNCQYCDSKVSSIVVMGALRDPSSRSQTWCANVNGSMIKAEMKQENRLFFNNLTLSLDSPFKINWALCKELHSIQRI